MCSSTRCSFVVGQLSCCHLFPGWQKFVRRTRRCRGPSEIIYAGCISEETYVCSVFNRDSNRARLVAYIFSVYICIRMHEYRRRVPAWLTSTSYLFLSFIPNCRVKYSHHAYRDTRSSYIHDELWRNMLNMYIYIRICTYLISNHILFPPYVDWKRILLVVVEIIINFIIIFCLIAEATFVLTFLPRGRR